ncbi:50S ribosomal protein L21, partial [bacterium]|nr:50S ribosomal protein L21 [bacterium]
LPVTGKVLEVKKDKKIIVFKMKAKKRYRKTQGHRQTKAKVLIEKI